MHAAQQSQNFRLGTIPIATAAALATMFALALLLFLIPSAQAQTYQVIYNFTGADGTFPDAGLTIDPAGNLYGTTTYSNFGLGFGTVFELMHTNSSWVYENLYTFMGGTDGGSPYSRVIFGRDGALYGTTVDGAGGCLAWGGCGMVFRLKRPATTCTNGTCPWTETVLYRFQGGNDGRSPYSEVTFDPAGNIYGTTNRGGGQDYGAVYKLTASGGGWSESNLWIFSGGSDGGGPFAGVILDHEGSIYGVAQTGGDPGCSYSYGGCGTVFQLTFSAGQWTENVLHTFHGLSDGAYPTGGLIFDQSGNLYGTTEGLGPQGPVLGPGAGGSVFMLSPADGGWVFSALHSFLLPPGAGLYGPWADLIMDSAGNLFGTTIADGAFGEGSVFKLTPSNGGWNFSSLHDFTGGGDGQNPFSNVVFDANGNMYGTAAQGGASGYGVVWEITP